MEQNKTKREKVMEFINKHEVAIVYGFGVIAGFTAGLLVKVNVTLKNTNLADLVNTLPKEATESYIVRSVEDPEKFIKIIKF